jgi:hypothetical protein
MKDSELRLNVADMVVSLSVEPGVRVLGSVDSFFVDEPAEAAINIRLRSNYTLAGGWHPLSKGESLGWNALGSADGKYILVERLGRDVLVQAPLHERCEVVDVLLGPSESPRSASSNLSELEILLVEVLPLPVVLLLSGRNGLFLHSCAVALNGTGILFSGVSGSGKSTMANLWRRFGPPASEVVDDEHILARHTAGSTLLYGAPWTRGPHAASFSRTPLKAVFFLAHGEQNKCIRMTAAEAFAQLLSQVFLPLWSREQVELTVQTCADLLQEVDCYHLEFVPRPEVVDFVQDLFRDSA